MQARCTYTSCILIRPSMSMVSHIYEQEEQNTRWCNAHEQDALEKSAYGIVRLLIYTHGRAITTNEQTHLSQGTFESRHICVKTHLSPDTFEQDGKSKSRVNTRHVNRTNLCKVNSRYVHSLLLRKIHMGNLLMSKIC